MGGSALFTCRVSKRPTSSDEGASDTEAKNTQMILVYVISTDFGWIQLHQSLACGSRIECLRKVRPWWRSPWKRDTVTRVVVTEEDPPHLCPCAGSMMSGYLRSCTLSPSLSSRNLMSSVMSSSSYFCCSRFSSCFSTLHWIMARAYSWRVSLSADFSRRFCRRGRQQEMHE